MLNDFIKVDLHIHSLASKYKESTDKDGYCCVSESRIENLDIILKKIDDCGINLFAFSDHNRFDPKLFLEAKDKISYSKYKNIKCILPSVEFDVQIDAGKDACHILTVFNVTTKEDAYKISRIIENNKLINSNEYYTREKFEEILKSIGLDSLLIACQRKDMHNDSGGHKCLSDSCQNPLEFIKTGYINALEYQSTPVEGMLINALSEFPKDLGISLVAGSDCHDWNYYPMHSKKLNHKNKQWNFVIKSLPTFKGLLLAFTSPKTRFKREKTNNPYIQSFSLNSKIYELSSGFNAIIGENGSCKSTILSGISEQEDKIKPYMADILKNNHFKRFGINNDCIKYIKQSQLIDSSSKNDEFFKEQIEFKKIDNSAFEAAIDFKANLILKKIQSNISLSNKLLSLKSTIFEFDEKLENIVPYYINVLGFSASSSNINPFEDRRNNLFKILNLIKEEYKNIAYNSSQKKYLQDAFISVNTLYKEIDILYKFAEKEILIKNIISSKVAEYSTSVKNKSTIDDTRKANYSVKKQKLIKSIIEYIIEQKNNSKIIINGITLPPDSGISRLSRDGFDFITTTLYHSALDINTEFYTNVFNSKYKDDASINSINTLDDASSAIRGTGKNKDFKKQFEKNVANFKDKLKNEMYDVTETTSKKKIGNTLGEKSIVFYKLISSNIEDNNVLLIDQPEDNISNSKINEKLIDYLNTLRDRIQIIFVTHNPLLVINMDVDNLIYLENDNGKINVQSGCLESDNILKLVAENMDGGKEAIKRRLKIYGS